MKRLKSILVVACLCLGWTAKAQTGNTPVVQMLSVGGSNNFYITTNIFVITTNVMNVVQVFTNAPIPLEQLTSPIIDAQFKNRRLYGMLAGPIALSVTNFAHGSRVEVMIDNPQGFPIRWPAGRWNGQPVSPTNLWPRVLIDAINNSIELTQ